MTKKLDPIATLPEVDLFEIVTPPEEQIMDREDIVEFKIAVRLRKPVDFNERVHVFWRKERVQNELDSRRTYTIHAIYYDENDNPLFKSKPFRVNLKRRTN
jgi:hypothetical protein